MNEKVKKIISWIGGIALGVFLSARIGNKHRRVSEAKEYVDDSRRAVEDVANGIGKSEKGIESVSRRIDDSEKSVERVASGIEGARNSIAESIGILEDIEKRNRT